MYHYTLYGLHIQTDLSFPQLIAGQEDDQIDITIEMGTIPEDILEEVKKGIPYSFSQSRSWFTNLTVKMFIEDGKRITYQLTGHGTPTNLNAFLLGWGMSILCLQRNISCMHCSVVTDGQHAFLISGRSGCGKSTLTQNLLKKGFLFMADDIAAIQIDDKGVPMVQPAFPYQKLCRDVACTMDMPLESLIYIDEDKDKFLVPCHEQFYHKPLPIGGMIVLYRHDIDDLIHTQELQGLDRFYACTQNLFLAYILGEARFAPHIGNQMLKVAAHTPVLCISRPNEKDTSHDVQAQALSFIAQCTSSAK